MTEESITTSFSISRNYTNGTSLGAKQFNSPCGYSYSSSSSSSNYGGMICIGSACHTVNGTLQQNCMNGVIT